MAPPSCWPAVALAGFLAGIALFPVPDARVLALVLCLLVGTGLLLKPERRLLLMLLALSAASGYLRMGVETRLLAVDPLEGMDRRELEVRGTVLEPPRPRHWGCAFRFRVERIEELPDLPPVELLAELRGDLRPDPGERWALQGRLASFPTARHPRGFDAGAWLARQGIHHRLRVQEARPLASPRDWGAVALIWRLRAWLVGNLETCLRPEAQALVLGILLGEARALPPELQDSFRRSGTAHLLAASGLNVAVVTGMVLWLCRRLGLGIRVAVLPAAAAASLYAMLAGASPSVVRAATMAVVGMAALFLGRRSSAGNSLLLAALLLLLARPGWLHDVGFQLSMAAVAGMLAWSEPLERCLLALPRTLRIGLSSTLSATLATAPFLAWHFQEVSAIALLANLVMTPVAEALLFLGLATSLAAGIGEPLARLPALACSLATEFLAAAARILGEAVQPVPVARPGGPMLAAAALAGVWLRLALAREGSRHLRRGLLALILVLFSWGMVPEPPRTGHLRIRLAELPRGSLAWVRTPHGRDLVLLETPQDLPYALEILALHGTRLPDEVFHPPRTESWGVSPEPGLRIQARPGSLHLTWLEFALVWVLRDASLEGVPSGNLALLPRAWSPRPALEKIQPQLLFWPGPRPSRPWRERSPAWWSSDEHGPLEIETDGKRMSWRRWRG